MQARLADEVSAPPAVCFRETLPNGATYMTINAYGICNHMQVYAVPQDSYFMMSDNRNYPASLDLSSVGYVPFENLIGRAGLVFFSIRNGQPAWQHWRWPSSIRWQRLLSVVH